MTKTSEGLNTKSMWNHKVACEGGLGMMGGRKWWGAGGDAGGKDEGGVEQKTKGEPCNLKKWLKALSLSLLADCQHTREIVSLAAKWRYVRNSTV